jgi:hypothetical protein
LPKVLACIHTAGGFGLRRFLSAAFWVRDGKTKVPGSNPSSRQTKPPLKAVNQESQQPEPAAHATLWSPFRALTFGKWSKNDPDRASIVFQLRYLGL